MFVAGLDWCASSNAIVSSSHDRSAYVWQLEEATNTWKPVICVLHITRAALAVKWSPNGASARTRAALCARPPRPALPPYPSRARAGLKFAATSGAKCVSVCYYDNAEGNNWWVGKVIKKQKSTVLSVAWHPNSQIIATGCADFKCRIFSALMGEVDEGCVRACVCVCAAACA